MTDEIQKKLADALTGRALPISIKNNNSDEVRKYEIYQPSFGLLIETSRILSDIGINELEQVFEGKNIFNFMTDIRTIVLL